MKKRYLLIILFMLMMIPVKTEAADLNLSLKKTGDYNCNMRRMILPTYNQGTKVDGYLHCSTDFDADSIICTRYDLDNTEIWEKEVNVLNNMSIEVLFSGGEKEVKGESDILVTKYSDDNPGEIAWEAQYGGNGMDLYSDLLNYYDKDGNLSGYLLIGTTWSTDIPNINAGYLMVMFDLDGNKVWEKNIVNLTNEISGENTLTFAGEYQIGKMTMDTYEEIFIEENDMYINKLIESKKANGEVDGYITVGSGNFAFYNPNDFFNVTNNELTTDIETFNVIVKYDLAGNVVWKKELSDYTSSALFDVIASKDLNGNFDGYIAVGVVENEIAVPKGNDGNQVPEVTGNDEVQTPEVKGIVIKYDLDGNVVWQKLHDENDTHLMTITENYNNNGNFNGYMIAGRVFAESVPDTCNLKEYFLKYTYSELKIKTTVSKGGSLVVDNRALPGEVVRINVTPDEGYVIEKITVLDSDGKEIEIKDNSFTMPQGEVSVKVAFARLSNPQTAAVGYTIVLIILIIGIATFTVKNQKQQEIELLED